MNKGVKGGCIIVVCLLIFFCSNPYCRSVESDGEVVFDPKKEHQFSVTKKGDLGAGDKCRALYVDVFLYTEGMQNDRRVQEVRKEMRNKIKYIENGKSKTCDGLLKDVNKKNIEELNIRVDDNFKGPADCFIESVDRLWFGEGSNFDKIIICITCVGYVVNAIPDFYKSVNNTLNKPGNYMSIECINLIEPIFYWHKMVSELRKVVNMTTGDNVDVGYANHVKYIRQSEEPKEWENIGDYIAKTHVKTLNIFRCCEKGASYPKSRMYTNLLHLFKPASFDVKVGEVYGGNYNEFRKMVRLLLENKEYIGIENIIKGCLYKGEKKDVYVIDGGLGRILVEKDKNLGFIFYVIGFVAPYLNCVGRCTNMWDDCYFNGFYSTDKEYLLGKDNLIDYNWIIDISTGKKEAAGVRRNRIENAYNVIQGNLSFKDVKFYDKGGDFSYYVKGK